MTEQIADLCLPHFSITKLANITDAFTAIFMRSGDARAKLLGDNFKAILDQMKGVLQSKADFQTIERNGYV